MTKEEAIKFWKFRYENAKDYTDSHWEAQECREHREYVEALRVAIEALKADAVHESCEDCPLYDQERHSCPRFNKVIPKTLAEVVQGEWEHWGSPFSEDDIINTMVCTNCGMRFVEIKGETFYYCPNRGADMRGKKE